MYRSSCDKLELTIEPGIESSEDTEFRQVRRNDRSDGSNTDSDNSISSRMKISRSRSGVSRPAIAGRARDGVVEQVVGLVNIDDRQILAIREIEFIEI